MTEDKLEILDLKFDTLNIRLANELSFITELNNLRNSAARLVSTGNEKATQIVRQLDAKLEKPSFQDHSNSVTKKDTYVHVIPDNYPAADAAIPKVLRQFISPEAVGLFPVDRAFCCGSVVQPNVMEIPSKCYTRSNVGNQVFITISMKCVRCGGPVQILCRAE